MTIRRMDHAGIVVDAVDAVVARLRASGTDGIIG